MCNAIPILSPFFLHHPYISHSLIQRILFSSYYCFHNTSPILSWVLYIYRSNSVMNGFALRSTSHTVSYEFLYHLYNSYRIFHLLVSLLFYACMHVRVECVCGCSLHMYMQFMQETGKSIFNCLRVFVVVYKYVIEICDRVNTWAKLDGCTYHKHHLVLC